ncbi:MAG: hypothetical protein QM647_10125 [Asticcacaulis sp.]|uniref:energy transducer TonB n=1 Tax=Asticcacaulis sp. TaxID=1872648 RepID=UPI0039E48104
MLLHLALLYYFFNHTFTTAFVDNPPETPSTTLEFYQPPVPPPPTDQKPAPSKVIVAHTPVATTPVDVPTVPIPPQKAQATDDGTKTPPVISTGQGEALSSASANPYVEARWTRFPDAAALGEYYPERAANDEIEGTATVECTVLDAAGRVSCRALSEVPGNYGFGKATVRMVQDKGRVDTTQGNVRIGSVLRTTVKWQLG